jgi:hypothetical protein
MCIKVETGRERTLLGAHAASSDGGGSRLPMDKVEPASPATMHHPHQQETRAQHPAGQQHKSLHKWD